MGSDKAVVVVKSTGQRTRQAEPSALTTPVLSDNGTEPVWIEGDALGGSPAAGDVSITDSGNYYTGTDVEAALQEVAADVAGLSAGSGGVGEGLPTVAGSAYVLPGLTISGSTAVALATGTRYYYPIIVQQTITVVNLVAEVTANNAAGRAMRGGLYAADEDWVIGSLVGEGAFDATSTGVKTISIAQSINAGRYVICTETNNSTTTWRVWQTDAMFAATGANGMIRAFQVSGTTYGTLPDPGVAWDSFLLGTTPAAHRVVLQVDPSP